MIFLLPLGLCAWLDFAFIGLNYADNGFAHVSLRVKHVAVQWPYELAVEMNTLELQHVLQFLLPASLGTRRPRTGQTPNSPKPKIAGHARCSRDAHACPTKGRTLGMNP